MTNKIAELIQSRRAQRHATDTGTRVHAKLQHATRDTIAPYIKNCPRLEKYFIPNARTEVPIAGFIGDKFISRRIDRMIVDNDTKKILILDYKTDINRNTHRPKYICQLREYRKLIQMIYPDFDIETSILWTHDWTLEKI
ncbi:hypothetical protein HDR61_02770 [bacterium]|nr:hypothetical protein [bacterium]